MILTRLTLHFCPLSFNTFWITLWDLGLIYSTKFDQTIWSKETLQQRENWRRCRFNSWQLSRKVRIDGPRVSVGLFGHGWSPGRTGRFPREIRGSCELASGVGQLIPWNRPLSMSIRHASSLADNRSARPDKAGRYRVFSPRKSLRNRKEEKKGATSAKSETLSFNLWLQKSLLRLTKIKKSTLTFL